MKLFRAARPANFAWNYTKTLAQTAVFWSVFLVVLPAIVDAVEDSAGVPQFSEQRPLAVVAFCLFGALGLTSGFVMARSGHGTPLPTDSPRRLVVVGPYRHVRNPMAIAGLSQGLATALWFGSWSVVGYVMVGGVLWDRLIRPGEEADLEGRFGEEFQRYRSEIRCWVPRRRAYR